ERVGNDHLGERGRDSAHYRRRGPAAGGRGLVAQGVEELGEFEGGEVHRVDRMFWCSEGRVNGSGGTREGGSGSIRGLTEGCAASFAADRDHDNRQDENDRGTNRHHGWI